jgi:uncharacterized membrane protein
MMPNMPPSAAADSMLLRVRALAVASLLALIALGLAWELWLAPTGNRTLALKVLPLAAALVGLLKFRLVTYRWVSLLVWVYFIEGVVRATSGAGASVALGAAEIVLCLLLFAACVMHVRRRLRAAGGKRVSAHGGSKARVPACTARKVVR